MTCETLRTEGGTSICFNGNAV